jgi:MraZ protein
VFLGKYSLVLDDMDRFLPPARFTKNLTSVFYIAQGFDHNLWVLPLNVFETIYRRIGSLNLADPLARMLLRMILSTAQETQANQDGTIAIPKELKEFAKINQTFLAIGQGDYFEIWEPASWEKQEILLRDAKTNTNRFSSLSIIAR